MFEYVKLYLDLKSYSFLNNKDSPYWHYTFWQANPQIATNYFIYLNSTLWMMVSDKFVLFDWDHSLN